MINLMYHSSIVKTASSYIKLIWSFICSQGATLRGQLLLCWLCGMKLINFHYKWFSSNRYSSLQLWQISVMCRWACWAFIVPAVKCIIICYAKPRLSKPLGLKRKPRNRSKSRTHVRVVKKSKNKNARLCRW